MKASEYDVENLLITNQEKQLKEVLRFLIERSDEILICSPFVTSDPLVYQLLEDTNKKIEIVLKLDYPTTPQFLESILKYISQNKHIYVYARDTKPSLHAKIYFFRKNKKHVAAIMGSSNLTTQGITTNFEINILTKKHLKEIFNYIQEIKKRRYDVLSRDVIEEYKRSYRRPEIPRGYKETKYYNKIYDRYENILERYNIIKAAIQDIHIDKQLPFTYEFDAFCHHLEQHMMKKEYLKPLNSFNVDDVRTLYKLFIDKYFIDKYWRIELYNRSQLIVQNMELENDGLIRNFFHDIHSVSFGSGRGERKSQIKREKIKKLRNLLKLMLNESMNISQRVALALIPNSKYKVRYLGESSIMEIPGRLFPEYYPIVNGKFHSTLKFLSA